jgi:hypothetical protein
LKSGLTSAVLSLSGKIDTSIHLFKEHPSVCIIKENKLITEDLNFKPVSSDFVSKQINKLNVKKAFDKSIKIAAIYLFSSKAFFQSSIIFSKAV